MKAEAIVKDEHEACAAFSEGVKRSSGSSRRGRAKVRDAVVAMMFAIILLGPLLMMGATKILHMPMPEWLSPQGAVWLLGGHSNTSIRASLNYEGILSGRLQSTLEDKVEDYIPCKKTALLLPAALQAKVIEASSAIGRWSVYPTFYGSSYLFSSGDSALARMPLQPSPAFLEKLEDFARHLAEFVQRYPETDFCVVLADQSDIAAANPAFTLVPGAIPDACYADMLAAWTDKAPNLSIVTVPYEEAVSYYHDYYRSDHHWNGYGALRAYLAVAERYGLPVDEAREEYETDLPGLEGIVENGSNTRYGLFMVNEPAQEPCLDLSDLVLEQGEAAPVLDRDVAALLAKGASVEHNFYEAWYGYRGSQSFTSSSGGTANALLLCDSFGTAFKYPFARGFARTDVAYALHLDTKSVPTLAESLETAQPDMVVFVARLDNYANLLIRFPDYFATSGEEGRTDGLL